MNFSRFFAATHILRVAGDRQR